MPTITTVDAAWDTGVTLDAAELRRVDTAMFLGDGSNNGVRGGVVRHGDTSLAVSVNGSDQVTVQAGAAVIPAATGLGVYRASLAAATSAVGIDPRNATNPRKDLVVFRATGAVDIITGTPGSSPSAPALPSGAVELARLNVPKVAGGAVTVDNSFRAYATGLGGVLPVESAARLPGSGNIKGQRAVALDTGLAHLWDSTKAAWELEHPVRMAAGTAFMATPVASVTVTFPSGRFNAPPYVTANCTNTGNVALTVGIGTTTSTSCQLFFYGIGGAWTSGAVSVFWQAMQEVA